MLEPVTRVVHSLSCRTTVHARFSGEREGTELWLDMGIFYPSPCLSSLPLLPLRANKWPTALLQLDPGSSTLETRDETAGMDQEFICKARLQKSIPPSLPLYPPLPSPQFNLTGSQSSLCLPVPPTPPSLPDQLPPHHPLEPFTSDITVYYKRLQGATAIRINGEVSRSFSTEPISLTGFLI